MSDEVIGGHVPVAFEFETTFGIEAEHGLAVVFHPARGATWGTGSALDERV